MNVTETAEVLTLMLNAWPGANINEGTPKVWAEMLVGVDPQDGLAAATGLMRSSKWFPSIAEFIEATRSARRVRLDNPEGREPRRELEESTGPPMTREQEKEHARKCLAEARRLVAEGRRKMGKVEGFKTVGESLGAVLESKQEEPF